MKESIELGCFKITLDEKRNKARVPDSKVRYKFMMLDSKVIEKVMMSDSKVMMPDYKVMGKVNSMESWIQELILMESDKK